MDFGQAIEFMLSFPDWERGTTSSRGQIMSLESVKSLLRRLEDPQLGRGTVHVTGSKGKGSTSTMLSGMLTGAGLKTALFTSPHLHSYREQICFNQVPITESEFAAGMDVIKQAVLDEHASDLGPVSTFGVLMALFFERTRNLQTHWQVVEVGLGGRTDATNVFDKKDLVIITPISLEHTTILGASASEIAGNKSAIITEGCTTVLAPQRDPAVKRVIQERCLQVDARLVDVSELYRTELVERSSNYQRFSIEGPSGHQQLQIRMSGAHQINNATTAFAACEALIDLGTELDTNGLAKGLATASIPGRFEILARNPTVIADGAHNDDSSMVLSDAIASYYPHQKCIVVLGTNADKDIRSICRNLAPLASRIIATSSRNKKALPPQVIADECKDFDLEVELSSSVEEAVQRALNLATRDDLICITGSLYVVAEARSCLAAVCSSAVFEL